MDENSVILKKERILGVKVAVAIIITEISVFLKIIDKEHSKKHINKDAPILKNKKSKKYVPIEIWGIKFAKRVIECIGADNECNSWLNDTKQILIAIQSNVNNADNEPIEIIFFVNINFLPCFVDRKILMNPCEEDVAENSGENTPEDSRISTK